MEEIWKPIKDFDDYFISNLGRVKSFKRNTEIILKSGLSSNKYLHVVLIREKERYNKSIHVLVAEEFLQYISDNNQNKVVDHIDNNSLNNCINNLQIITQRLNTTKDKQGFTSEFPGVSRNLSNKKWLSHIRYKNNRLYLGSFENELDAANIYKRALKDVENNIFDYTNYKQEIASRKLTTKSSKYSGVSWSKSNNKWCSEISINYKKISLGYYFKEEDAADIYNRAHSDLQNYKFILSKYIEERNNRKCRIRNRNYSTNTI